MPGISYSFRIYHRTHPTLIRSWQNSSRHLSYHPASSVYYSDQFSSQSTLPVTLNKSPRNLLYFPENVLRNRHFHTSSSRWDLDQKSKVEETIDALKEQKVKSSQLAVGAEQEKQVALPKKTIWQKVVHEAKHYYHGFRLLAAEVKISAGLLRKLIGGESLNRREHKQLVRTVSDIFRLVPFVVILVIPFAEFALPILLKFFPNMLPSTFEEKSKKEESIRKQLKIKLEMAKFLQETIHETALEHKQMEKSTKAEEFSNFFDRIRISGEEATKTDILKFAKHFEDEMTLDNLSRDVIVAMCRLLDIGIYGLPSDILRFQLRMRLRNLKSDDQVIQAEGVNNLETDELQSACRARGMKASGVSETRLRSQLQQWLDLSLDEKIPPSLLILTRAMYLPDNLSPEEQLKNTIAKMPVKLGDELEVKIAEQEGAQVDHEVKLRLVKEEQEAIKREHVERKEREEATRAVEASPPPVPASALHKGPATTAVLTEILVKTADLKDKKPEDVTKKDLIDVKPLIRDITHEDIDQIEDIIDKISKDKYMLLEQQDLREEAAEYKEDVQELSQIPEASDLQESKAAKRLSKQVDKMLKNMEKMMTQLESEKKELKQDITETKAQVKSLQKSDDVDTRKMLDIVDEMDQKKDHVLNIEHLLQSMRQLRKIPDEERMSRVAEVLRMMDIDKDGNIELEHALKVVELLGEENFKMSPKQLEDVIDVLRKEITAESATKETAMKEGKKAVPNGK